MENNINDIDCESVINTLKDGGIPITYFIIYDDNTDPNVLEYGERKSLYLQKANFVDDRIEKDYDKMKPLSGTVEVFSNKEDALERQGALKRSRDDKFAFRIISDNVLIRLSEEYTKEQAQEIADIAGGEIYSIDKDVDAREKFGDKLDPFQGEWKDTESNWHLIIYGTHIDKLYYENYGDTVADENYYVDELDFDEDGNLIVTNFDRLEIYTINEIGQLEINNGTYTDVYEKVSDNIILPPIIKKVDPAIGMTEIEVYNSTWGAPKKINETITAGGKREQWVYDKGYIYFKNGYVTAIQK